METSETLPWLLGAALVVAAVALALWMTTPEQENIIPDVYEYGVM